MSDTVVTTDQKVQAITVPQQDTVVAKISDSDTVAVETNSVVSVTQADTNTVAFEDQHTVSVDNVAYSVVTVGPPGGGGSKANVFILDVTPTSTGIVGQKTYDADTVPANTVLSTCASDTTDVRVHVGCNGGSAYSPEVTINGVLATLSESATKRWFTGYADVTLSGGENTITVRSNEGGSDFCTVEVAGPGPDVLSVVFGAYPGSQTELKAGDTISVTVTTEIDATEVVLQSGGAVSYTSNFPVTAGTASFNITINSASGAQSVAFKAKNALGTLGSQFNSSTLTLNQTYPSFGTPSVVYNNGFSALNIADTADVTITVSNADTVSYASGDVTIPSPSAYSATKTVTQLATGYVGSGTNYTITATREANNAVSSVSTLVKIATVAPTAAITISPTGRLVSSPVGISYEVRITPNQTLLNAPSLTASHGAWSGSWTLNGSYWRRNLVVSDATARGTGTFSSLVLTGLSNIGGSVITSGSTYTVGGFSSRTVTFPAFSRVAPLGVEVADQTKTTAQISGGSVLTRYTDNTVRTNGYYIADSNGDYNPTGSYIGLSDSAFAGSNTSGTLQAIVQEVA